MSGHAVAYGPALYRIVYADGFVGRVDRPLVLVLETLRDQRAVPNGWTTVRLHGRAVRVEPVPGTQYQAAHDGVTYPWWTVPLPDRAYLRRYAGARVGERLTALRLRSPVAS